MKFEPSLLRICTRLNTLQRQLFAVTNPHIMPERTQDSDSDIKTTQDTSSTLLSNQGEYVNNFKEELYNPELMDFRIYIHNRKLFDNKKYENFSMLSNSKKWSNRSYNRIWKLIWLKSRSSRIWIAGLR